ncbi:peptidoglycan-binding protein [Streptomyces sp. NPDC052043]|uniref:peptidoglycan-binding protein n=1 Tax=Streptomyces sp. NPDC052043 TaxID=3365684 RepID=UPI0037D7DD77
MAPAAEARTLSAQAYTCHYSASGGYVYAGYYSGNTVVPSASYVTNAGIEAQCLLKWIGYYRDSVDGIFGPHSQAAMKLAQKTMGGVSVDGFPGPQSWRGLRYLAGG